MLNRILIVCPVLFVLSASGCALQEQYVPAGELTAAQLRAQELYAQSEEHRAAHAGAQQMIAGLQSEQQTLNQSLADAKRRLSTANDRIENLLTEREDLKQRYARALESPQDDSILTNFGAAIPGFEFDHVTGLYRFEDDVKFDLGSAELRPEAVPVLKDFVSAVNSAAGAGSRVLIVGHTDDQRIVRGSTAAKHPTNWHLSTDRADSVIVKLRKLGLDEEQMAAMGYSKFQPLETSTDNAARQRNRRVELYLIPDSTGVARWDPVKALR